LSSFTVHDKDWHAFVIHDRGVTVQISNPADVRELWFKEFGGALFVPFSLMVIIMGSFIAIAATQAFKPIRELRQEIQARNPEFLPPLNNDFYPDELRVIVDALNDMLKRLDDAFLARQRFIAEAAHELRTPITAIRLNAEVLLTEQRQQAPSEAADNLQRGVERASHLVSQLLHLARFDPKFASARQFATVDLVDLAKTVVIEYDTLAARKAIDIGLIAPPQATLFGDMEALRILLSNLVDNAIRYTPEGGCIDVVIETSISALELSVIDNGPGIPEKDRKRAFEPFCRLNNNLPGSGLGLAIAEEIIQQHGAEIELSDSPNGGLTVRVLLPNSGRCQSLLP
jgi:two-component system OmpR family sensor kinase